jgi:hypothetical protein
MNRIVCACLLALLFVVPSRADYTISRTTINFGNVGVGLSETAGFSFTNTGSTSVTVSSVTLTGTGFQFATGTFPQVMSGKGDTTSYAFNFVPSAGQRYTGTATFMVDGAPVNITLQGTGVATTAVATPSVSGLTFSQPQGHKSRPLSVKITNTGTSTVKILSATTQQPFSTPPIKTTPLAPGASASVSVSYFGSNLGSTTGDLLITYDVLAPTGISLLGTTTAATNFEITTYPTLPLGTAGFSYLAQLTSAAGSGNVTWSLASGSSLPSGLTLSSGGTISGTISSTATLTTYTFTVNAVDAHSHTASEVLPLQVLAPTGSACNDISWDIASTTDPLIPIIDLGTGTYFGTEGGLYGNGSNTPPPQHDSDGIAFANAIQPLDSTGNPNPSGKYALVGIGISTLLYEMQAFVPMATADAATNPHLVIVNGGEPTASATDFANLSSPFWSTLLNNIVPNAGVTAQQVVAVMFEDVDVFPTGTYPSDMQQLQGEFETVAQNVLVEFPNVKLMYYATRTYSGYSGTFDKSSPEPYAYEQGFAIQGALLDQINGSASLNYNPANGPVKAPWLGYGPYTWANGLIARSDGLTYNCQDFLSDGRHPSKLYGAPKVASQFLKFFKTDDSTTPWFLAQQ